MAGSAPRASRFSALPGPPTYALPSGIDLGLVMTDVTGRRTLSIWRSPSRGQRGWEAAHHRGPLPMHPPPTRQQDSRRTDFYFCGRLVVFCVIMSFMMCAV